MNFRWTHLLAICLLVALVPLAPAKSVVIRAPYEGPALIAYGDLEDCADAVRSAGTVCLDIPVGTRDLDLRVTDLSDLPVGGSYYLHAADGTLLGMDTYCQAATIPVPREASVLVVRVEGINGAALCLNEGMAGAASKGIVALRLR